MTAGAGNLLIRGDATGEGLYAARAFRAGERVLDLAKVEWRERDRHTVEDPSGAHFFHPVLAATAHACEPNCRLSFSPRSLVALRRIAEGEAISIDYELTESVIGHPFDCLCGGPKCRGRIG